MLIDPKIIVKKVARCSIFFTLSLMIFPLNLIAKNELFDLQAVVQTVKELGYYFVATLKFHAALKIFSQKNNAIVPDITCRFCPKRPLFCDELIVKVQAKSMDSVSGEKDSVANNAREKMLSIYDGITQQLYTESLHNTRKYMVQIAQEANIQCEDCQKVEWQAIGVDKNLLQL